MAVTVKQIMEHLDEFFPDLEVRIATHGGLSTREMQLTDLHVMEPTVKQLSIADLIEDHAYAWRKSVGFGRELDIQNAKKLSNDIIEELERRIGNKHEERN